jgi:hypothetical protein
MPEEIDDTANQHHIGRHDHARAEKIPQAYLHLM